MQEKGAAQGGMRGALAVASYHVRVDHWLRGDGFLLRLVVIVTSPNQSSHEIGAVRRTMSTLSGSNSPA